MNHLNEETFNAYLDVTLDPASRAEADAHLATCPECGARLASLRVMFTSLERLPDAGLARDLSVGVVKAIKAKQAARPALTPAIRIMFVAQALLALVVAAIALPLGMRFLESLSDFELPVATINSLISNFQFSFTLPTLETFIPTNLFTVPAQLPVAEFSTLAMTIGLLGVTALWFVGNGLLLRPMNRATRK